MTLDRYILRLWLGPFLGGLIFVFSVMLLARALKLLGRFSDQGEAWSLIMELLILTMPFFILQIVPMAFFLALQNTITGLQQSSEMDAMRASGLSYKRIFRIFFVIAPLLWIGLTYVSMVQMPQAQLGFNSIVSKVSSMGGMIALEPQRFMHVMDSITVYVDGEEENGDYRGLVMEDHRDGVSVIYTARTARFSMQGENLVLALSDGVRLEGEGDSQRMLAFDRYQVSIPTSMGNRRVLRSVDHVTMMSAEELWQALQTRTDGQAAAEWHRRLLLPTTALVLLFFALPLSLTQKRSGKAGAMVFGVALLIVVYNLQLVLYQLVNQGALSGWSMWAGQILFLLAGLFLSKRAEEDRIPRLFSYIGEWFYLLHQVVTELLARRWKST